MPRSAIALYLSLFSSLLVFCSLPGCSPGFKSGEDSASSNSKLDSPNNDTTQDPGVHPPPAEVVGPPKVISPTLNYCSQIDFAGVSWPLQLAANGQSYLGLALNITGSFEGRKGWANLSNNFDGMGFSIGLLQQNLGMGSIQPMLDEMITMAANGDNFDLDSNSFEEIKSMIAQWKKDKAQLKSTVTALSFGNPFYPDDSVISFQDTDAGVQQDIFDINNLAPTAEIKSTALTATSLVPANQASVAWALNTVYSDGGRTFKPNWSGNLIKMAQSKPYIKLQLKYAMKIYVLAFQYFNAFQLTNLSQFLLMFDFVVQNGGFKQNVLSEYTVRLKANPKMTEQEKSLLILELRLKSVLPRWQNDVSERKKTIIFSEGQVHGAKRNLKIEYCYAPEATVLTQP